MFSADCWWRSITQPPDKIPYSQNFCLPRHCEESLATWAYRRKTVRIISNCIILEGHKDTSKEMGSYRMDGLAHP